MIATTATPASNIKICKMVEWVSIKPVTTGITMADTPPAVE